MSKWISLERATRKYELKREDVCIWAEIKEINAYVDGATLMIEEQSLRDFLHKYKTPPSKEYIWILEQLSTNQSIICEMYAEIVALQQHEIEYQKHLNALLERQKAAAIEQDRLNQDVINMMSKTHPASDKGWLDKLWMKIRKQGSQI